MKKNQRAEMSIETLVEEYVLSILKREIRRQTGKLPKIQRGIQNCFNNHNRTFYCSSDPLSIAVEFDQFKAVVTVSHPFVITKHDRFGTTTEIEIHPIKRLSCDLADPASKLILERLFSEDIKRFKKASWADLEDMRREVTK